MISLLSDVHFWTTNDMKINNSNYGVFNYSLNGKQFNSSPQNFSLLAKKEYWEKNHDGLMVLSNYRPTRLKDNLRKLECLLRLNKIIKLIWKDNCIVQILLSNGVLVYLCINLFTGDILKLAFDKYFIGKLAADTITDAFFSSQNIILAYNTNQITIVNIHKPNMRRYGPEKIANMEPKVFHVIVPGPTGDKKLSRNLAVNNNFDLMVIWTKSSRNEIFPWRPTKRDQDQANVHVFRLKSGKIEAIGYCWTQNDPMCVEFLSTYGDCQFITVEQKVSRKGEISIEIHSYKIMKGKLPRTTLHSIPLHTEVCSYSFSPDQEKIFLGTVDCFVCIHDLKQQTTKFSSKTEIIPYFGIWHSDSTLILIADQQSQVQIFDIALNSVLNQLVSDDIGQNCLNLGAFVNLKATKLLNIAFSLKPQMNIKGRVDKYAQTDSFVIFNFDNGQIGCIRFFATTGINNDVHNSGLTSDIIVNRYLEVNQLEKAVSILLATNWESNGSICLISLHKITNFCLMKSKMKRNHIELLLKAFKSFSSNLNDEIKDEYGDQIIDLKRRLFFYFIKNEKYSEGFEIANQIEDYDLFMDIFNCTKTDINLLNLTNQSYNQAEFYYNQNESTTVPDDNLDSNDTTSSSSSDCLTTSFTTIEKDNKVRRKSIPNIMGVTKNFKISNAVIKPPETLTLKPFSDDSSSNESTIGSNFTPIKSVMAEVTYLKKNYVPPLPTLSNHRQVNEFQSSCYLASSESKVHTNLSQNFNTTEFRPIQTESNTLREYDINNHVESIRSVPGPSQNYSSRNSFDVAEATSSASLRNLSKHNLRSIWSRIPDQTIGIPHLSPIKQNRGAVSLISSISSNSPHSSLTYQFNSNSDELQNIALELTQSPKLYQHPLVSGTIPPANYFNENLINIGPSGITNRPKIERQEVIYSNVENIPTNYKKDSGISVEKNKVKFSDTIQIAVVQEVKKEKPLPLKRSFPTKRLPDPEKELAESLPLCHPKDNYLKDFEPLQGANVINPNISTTNNTINAHNNNGNDNNNFNVSNSHNNSINNNSNISKDNHNNNNNNGSIKVIHFGVV